MVFGGNSIQVQDFKEFAQQQVVNYIWTFVEGVQTGLDDELGSIKGFVASQAIAAAAQQVLNGLDFQLLGDFARRYQHFAELRLTPECLKDNSMLAYVNRLSDASDDSRPECHVHSISQTDCPSRAVSQLERSGGEFSLSHPFLGLGLGLGSFS